MKKNSNLKKTDDSIFYPRNSFILLAMSIGIGLGSIVAIILNNARDISIGRGIGASLGFIRTIINRKRKQRRDMGRDTGTGTSSHNSTN